MADPLRILFATPEIAPWVKTGGLGDVAGALPPALIAAGAQVHVLVPYYPALRTAFPDARLLAAIDAPGGLLPACRLLEAQSGELTLWLLDMPAMFHRGGSPYLAPDGGDWSDNALRFGLLSRIAALLASDASPLDWRPDVLHLQDWQTALAPAYLHFTPGPKAASVITVHNMAFQGLFPAAVLADLALPPECFQPEGLEFWGQVSFLKAGLHYADTITTVSPTYAREIQTPALGFGMDGLLRRRASQISGILNGIDYAAWNPANDPLIACPFDADHLDAKAANTAAVRARLGLADEPHVPLLGVVSRLTHQKGLDWLAETAGRILDLPAQIAVLGSGDAALEKALEDTAATHPGRMAVTIGFDEAMAHQIEAGADAFLMPSRFEPCGLNQMYSLRYGTPPVVRATGGLADTVVDPGNGARSKASANGFVFEDESAEAFFEATARAVATWHNRNRWRRLQRNGMARDFSWRHAAQEYLTLYRRLKAARVP
ncbi:MAG: glycogen synthase GlgA [Betaproteobacteria bacterium]|nr:glycogen synthase GlgA [Betaproteobacteria bacterium]